MRRSWLFWCGSAIAGLSAAAFLASLWHCSYRNGDFCVALGSGELLVTSGPTYYGPGFKIINGSPRLLGIRWWPDGPWIRRYTISGYAPMWRLTLPLWAPWSLGAALVAIGWPAPHRARRRPGYCPSCGYDARGLSGPCPECGRAAARE